MPYPKTAKCLEPLRSFCRGSALLRLLPAALLGAQCFTAGLAPVAVAQQSAAEPVPVFVNWDERSGVIAPDAYSVNAFRGFEPETMENPAYQANIAYMKPGQLRYHNHSGLVRDSKTTPFGWMDVEARKWDVNKIRRATAAWPKEPEAMFSISRWPEWMEDKYGRLKPEYVDDYVALCAELVKILNVDLGLKIKYWEPFNERETSYIHKPRKAGEPGDLKPLIDIYNRCAVAMKAVDPTIKVGGPAVSSITWTDIIKEFAEGTVDNLDFFSCHVYATNDSSLPDERIFNIAASWGQRAKALRDLLDRISPKRTIPISVNEFNVSWTWESRDPRMTNHKGAVFDAIAMTTLLTNGADSTVAWNDVDGIYGKMSRDFELRPSAHLYHVLNRNFIGNVVATQSSDPQRVVVFAVVQGNGAAPALMLVNRSGTEQEVRASVFGQGWQKGDALTRHEIAESGYSQNDFNWEGGTALTLPLPPYSVTLLTERAAVAE